jgi:hypothetical protein
MLFYFFIFIFSERRANISATAGYAATLVSGQIDNGPSLESAARLRMIRECFAGDPAKGDSILHTQADTLSRLDRTRDDILASLRARTNPPTLPEDWESKIRVPRGADALRTSGAVGGSGSGRFVQDGAGVGSAPSSMSPYSSAMDNQGSSPLLDVLLLSFEKADLVPVSISEMPTLVNALRLGVTRVWPTGSLSQRALSELASSMGVPDRPSLRDVLALGIAWITASILGEASKARDPWVLVEPSLRNIGSAPALAEAVSSSRRGQYAFLIDESLGSGMDDGSSSTQINREREVWQVPTPSRIYEHVESWEYDPDDEEIPEALARSTSSSSSDVSRKALSPAMRGEDMPGNYAPPIRDAIEGSRLNRKSSVPLSQEEAMNELDRAWPEGTLLRYRILRMLQRMSSHVAAPSNNTSVFSVTSNGRKISLPAQAPLSVPSGSGLDLYRRSVLSASREKAAEDTSGRGSEARRLTAEHGLSSSGNIGSSAGTSRENAFSRGLQTLQILRRAYVEYLISSAPSSSSAASSLRSPSGKALIDILSTLPLEQEAALAEAWHATSPGSTKNISKDNSGIDSSQIRSALLAYATLQREVPVAVPLTHTIFASSPNDGTSRSSSGDSNTSASSSSSNRGANSSTSQKRIVTWSWQWGLLPSSVTEVTIPALKAWATAELTAVGGVQSTSSLLNALSTPEGSSISGSISKYVLTQNDDILGVGLSRSDITDPALAVAMDEEQANNFAEARAADFIRKAEATGSASDSSSAKAAMSTHGVSRTSPLEQLGNVSGAALLPGSPITTGGTSISSSSLTLSDDSLQDPTVRKNIIASFGAGAPGVGAMVASSLEERFGPILLENGASATLPPLPPLTDVDADEIGVGWDPSHVRKLLTQPDYLRAAFDLPRTKDTLEAAARVTGAAIATADAKLTVPQINSVDQIEARLKALIEAGGSVESVGTRISGNRRVGILASREVASAKSALSALTSLPSHLVRSAHALLCHSSRLSLRKAMEAEYAAIARVACSSTESLISLVTAANGDAYALGNTLCAPLTGIAAGSRSASLSLPRRKIFADLLSSRAAEIDSWTKALTVEYEKGLHSGALGDVMRRRFAWIKRSLTASEYDPIPLLGEDIEEARSAFGSRDRKEDDRVRAEAIEAELEAASSGHIATATALAQARASLSQGEELTALQRAVLEGASDAQVVQWAKEIASSRT